MRWGMDCCSVVIGLISSNGLMSCIVGNVAAQRRRQHAITVAKERREAVMRTKRLCRAGVSGEGDDPVIDGGDMMIDAEQSILESQTTAAVEELKLAMSYQYV